MLDRVGNTPLHYATQMWSQSVVRMLLERGANIGMKVVEMTKKVSYRLRDSPYRCGERSHNLWQTFLRIYVYIFTRNEIILKMFAQNVYEEAPVEDILPETMEAFLDEFCLTSHGDLTNKEFKVRFLGLGHEKQKSSFFSINIMAQNVLINCLRPSLESPFPSPHFCRFFGFGLDFLSNRWPLQRHLLFFRAQSSISRNRSPKKH